MTASNGPRRRGPPRWLETAEQRVPTPSRSVTFDINDFPPQACEPVGAEATHPDDFLLDLYDLNPEAVRAALEQQAADLNPAWPLDELLRALTAAGVPRFADAIRAQR